MKRMLGTVLVSLALISSAAHGQTGKRVAPNTINALATALKTAVDGDVFILERDALYPNQGQL